MKAFRISKNWQIFLAILVVIFWVKVYRHFTQMDDRFFPESFQGMQGLLFYETGNYKAAAEAYRAHFIKTDDWEERNDPALNALLQGDLFSAEMIAKSDLEKGQNEMNAALTLGEVALANKKDDVAQAWFNRVLENHRDQFDALLLSSLVQARAGRDGEAIDLMNRALRHYRIESRITSFFWVLAMTGDLLEAPDSEQYHTLLAHYFRYLRIFDNTNARQALVFAKKGIANNRHSESAHLTMGIVFHKERKVERALSAYWNAIKIRPDYAEAYRRMSQIYSDRGDLAKEYEVIKTAYESAPKDYFYIQFYQHFLADKLGDYYQALVFTEQLLEENPEDINLIKTAAYYLRFIGKAEKAAQHYKKGLVFYPGNPSLYEGLGYSYLKLEQLEDARHAFQAALSINDRRPQAYVGLSLLYNNTKQFLEAIEALEKAFFYGYKSDSQSLNLCTLYHHVSQFEKAATCLKRILSDDPRNIYAGNLLVYTLRNLEAQ